MRRWLSLALPWIVRALHVALSVIVIGGIIVVMGLALIGASLVLPGGVGF